MPELNDIVKSDSPVIAEKKPWYLSKTLWALVCTAAITVYNGVAPQNSWPPVPEYLILALTALGLYGRTQATQPLGK